MASAPQTAGIPGRGQDALRSDHPVVVVRGRLAADQDHPLAALGPLLRLVGAEHDFAGGRPRRGIQTRGDGLGLGLDRHDRLQQLLQPVRVDPEQGRVLIDQPLTEHVRGHDPFSECSSLAHPSLEDPEVPLLDRELDVAHVAVVHLERVHDLEQFAVRHRVEPPELGERERVADPGDDVLALGVRQVVAVGDLLAAGRIARECHAGTRVLAAVAEHHRHDVHGGAEVVGDLVLAAVVDRALAVPALEDGLGGQAHLRPGVSGERAAGPLLVDLEKLVDQRAEVFCVEIRILSARALALLRRVERVLERPGRHAHHDLPEHLDEPAIGIVRESDVVPGLMREALQ
jgi:hypothetical protein